MHRTTIMLPVELKERAEEYGKQTGASLAEVMRTALSREIFPQKESLDPFLNDRRVSKKKSPKDVSVNHDDYLYGKMV